MHRTVPPALVLLAAPLLLAADTPEVAGTQEVASRSGANVQAPRWSPDGSQLAYEANFHDRKVIELYVGAPGGAFARVTPTRRSASSLTAGFATRDGGGKVAHELSWAPASVGARFVYAGSNDALDYDLFLGGAGALAPHPAADGGPTWSPDGRNVAFTSSRTGQGDLYVLDVTSSDLVPRQLTNEPTSSELYAAWSSDGTRLAYVGHSDAGDNLWLLPTLESAPVQLTDWRGTQTRPAFSPTDEWIAFYADHEAEGRFDLYVTPPKRGATPRKLVEGVVPNAGGPTWTPDGAHLVVVLDDDDRFDPVAMVPVADPSAVRVLDLGTVGHGDLDLVAGADGVLKLAFVAQGRRDDEARDFKRLFVAELRP